MRNARVPSLAVALMVLLVPSGRGQGPTITYPAGACTVTTPAATTIEQGPGFVTLRWAESPTPKPVPTPPDPAPDGGQVPRLADGTAWVLLIADPAPTPRESLVASASSLDVIVKGYAAADPTATSYAAKAARKYPGIRPPALIVAQAMPPGGGDVVHAMPLPADDAAVMAVIKRLRGRP